MQKILRAIRENKSFLITAHVNPEGDSLGSQLAMKELLDALGKESFIYDNDQVPAHLMFMPKASLIRNCITPEDKFDAAIVLDCPNLKRTGKVADAVDGKFTINIDHHISNENFGDVNWVDAKASSAGEMVYRLFKELGVPLSKEAALSLYIAILTDTGSFNYDNTSKATHEIAGELLGYGLDPSDVSEKVYETKNVRDVKLLGMVLSTIKVDKTGAVAHMELTKSMLDQTGADIAKSEGLVNYARSIDTAKVAILFREDPRHPGKIHISFRAKAGADVNKIAAFFGGGGHTRASGCVIEGALAEVKAKVLAKVEETL